MAFLALKCIPSGKESGMLTANHTSISRGGLNDVTTCHPGCSTQAMVARCCWIYKHYAQREAMISQNSFCIVGFLLRFDNGCPR